MCIDKSLATAEELTAALSPAECHVILCDYEREAINALEIEGIFESHQFIYLPDLEGSVYIRSLAIVLLVSISNLQNASIGGKSAMYKYEEF